MEGENVSFFGGSEGGVKFSQGFLQKEMAFTQWKLNSSPMKI